MFCSLFTSFNADHNGKGSSSFSDILIISILHHLFHWIKHMTAMNELIRRRSRRAACSSLSKPHTHACTHTHNNNNTCRHTYTHKSRQTQFHDTASCCCTQICHPPLIGGSNGLSSFTECQKQKSLWVFNPSRPL